MSTAEYERLGEVRDELALANHYLEALYVLALIVVSWGLYQLVRKGEFGV